MPLGGPQEEEHLSLLFQNLSDPLPEIQLIPPEIRQLMLPASLMRKPRRGIVSYSNLKKTFRISKSLKSVSFLTV
jgi:hypothetical protein